jgi:hypothetical protein
LRWTLAVAVFRAGVGHEVLMSTAADVARRKTAITQYVGLDVSVKETVGCIVNEPGKIVGETKIAIEPKAIPCSVERRGIWLRSSGWKQGRHRNG